MLVDDNLRQVRILGELPVSVQQQRQNLLRGREGSVRGQKHVDVGGLQLAIVRGQALHQLLQSGCLHEPHSYRLPFQVWDLIFWVLSEKQIK